MRIKVFNCMTFLVSLVFLTSISATNFGDDLETEVMIRIDLSPTEIKYRKADLNEIFEQVERRLDQSKTARIEFNSNASILAELRPVEWTPAQVKALRQFRYSLLGKIMSYKGKIKSINVVNTHEIDNDWLKALLKRNEIEYILLQDLPQITGEVFTFNESSALRRIVVSRCGKITEEDLLKIDRAEILYYGDGPNLRRRIGETEFSLE